MLCFDVVDDDEEAVSLGLEGSDDERERRLLSFRFLPFGGKL